LTDDRAIILATWEALAAIAAALKAGLLDEATTADGITRLADTLRGYVQRNEGMH
jgi:hypothetical protein